MVNGYWSMVMGYWRRRGVFWSQGEAEGQGLFTAQIDNQSKTRFKSKYRLNQFNDFMIEG